MLEPIEARTGVRPTELLVDGGYSSHDALDQAAAVGVTVYAPVPKPRSKASETPAPPPIDAHLPKPGDSDAFAAWRVRMSTDSAKQIYKQRAAIAETVNADPKAHRRHGRHRVARSRQGHRQRLSLRTHRVPSRSDLERLSAATRLVEFAIDFRALPTGHLHCDKVLEHPALMTVSA
jgi:hypothetical protein